MFRLIEGLEMRFEHCSCSSLVRHTIVPRKALLLARIMLDLSGLQRQARVHMHSDSASGRNPGVSQLNDEGMHMPVFSFEKIAAPVRPNPIANVEHVEKKQRGVIIQMLGRFVEARVKRAPPKNSTDVRFQKTPAE